MFQLILVTGVIILLFQIVYGSMALRGKTAINFSKITVTTIILNTTIFIIGFIILSNYLRERKIRCLIPLEAYMLFALFSFIILIVVIAAQATIKYLAGSGKL